MGITHFTLLRVMVRMKWINKGEVLKTVHVLQVFIIIVITTIVFQPFSFLLVFLEDLSVAIQKLYLILF